MDDVPKSRPAPLTAGYLTTKTGERTTTKPTYRNPGEPILDPRFAAAEATAAIALILVQHHATWEGLHAAALAADAGNEAAAMAELRKLVGNPIQAGYAVTYLEILDHAARGWAQIAHGPGVRSPILPPPPMHRK